MLSRILALVLAGVTLFGIVTSAIPVAYATELEGEITEEVETTAPVVEEEEQEEVIINGIDTLTNHAETDCVLGFAANCPEGFMSSVLVMIQNDETGQKYKLYLEALNSYYEKMYVPAGHYTILEVSVPTASAFTFIMDTTGVTATESGHEELTFTMKDLDKIVMNENGQFEFDRDESGQVEIDNGVKLFDTPYDFIKISKSQELYYNVSYNGQSNMRLDVCGYSTKDFNGVVKITKSGILGEAQYQISLDGGATYFQNVFTASGGTVIDSIGLTFRFSSPNDTDELIEGDTYSFKTIRTFLTEASTDPDKAMMLTVGAPTHSVNYIVTVMSSGGPGVSKISVKREDDKTGESNKIYTIPENGIVDLEDNVKLVFNKNCEYAKDQNFKVYIALGEVVPVDYTPLFIFGGVVGFMVIVGLVVLSSKKDKKTNYIIKKYDCYQDESEYDK